MTWPNNRHQILALTTALNCALYTANAYGTCLENISTIESSSLAPLLRVSNEEQVIYLKCFVGPVEVWMYSKFDPAKISKYSQGDSHTDKIEIDVARAVGHWNGQSFNAIIESSEITLSSDTSDGYNHVTNRIDIGRETGRMRYFYYAQPLDNDPIITSAGFDGHCEKDQPPSTKF